MKNFYQLIALFIILITFLITLYAQNIKPINNIQGNWKCIKINYIVNNRKLTTSEFKGEKLIRKINLGKINAVTKDKFYFYDKNGKIEDSTLYKINGDTLLFLDKIFEYFNKEIAYLIYKIDGNFLTIDMYSLDNKIEYIHSVYKKIKLKQLLFP